MLISITHLNKTNLAIVEAIAKKMGANIIEVTKNRRWMDIVLDAKDEKIIQELEDKIKDESDKVEIDVVREESDLEENFEAELNDNDDDTIVSGASARIVDPGPPLPADEPRDRPLRKAAAMASVKFHLSPDYGSDLDDEVDKGVGNFSGGPEARCDKGLRPPGLNPPRDKAAAIKNCDILVLVQDSLPTSKYIHYNAPSLASAVGPVMDPRRDAALIKDRLVIDDASAAKYREAIDKSIGDRRRAAIAGLEARCAVINGLPPTTDKTVQGQRQDELNLIEKQIHCIKTHNPEWLHTIANSLGGPLTRWNMAAGSHAANTQMEVLENELATLPGIRVEVTQYKQANTHKAEWYIYTIYAEGTDEPPLVFEIDAQRDWYNEADLAADRASINAFLEKTEAQREAFEAKFQKQRDFNPPIIHAVQYADPDVDNQIPYPEPGRHPSLRFHSDVYQGARARRYDWDSTPPHASGGMSPLTEDFTNDTARKEYRDWRNVQKLFSYIQRGEKEELLKLSSTIKDLSLNVLDYRGRTPLMAAIYYKQVPSINFLLNQKGLDINQANEKGITALHYAVGSGNLNLVKALVERGADVNARDVYGETPLSIAQDDGLDDIARFLITNGAKPPSSPSVIVLATPSPSIPPDSQADVTLQTARSPSVIIPATSTPSIPPDSQADVILQTTRSSSVIVLATPTPPIQPNVSVPTPHAPSTTQTARYDTAVATNTHNKLSSGLPATAPKPPAKTSVSPAPSRFIHKERLDKQLGWNCGDVAIGYNNRQVLYDYLRNNVDDTNRRLLALEIMNAALITRLDQQAHGKVKKPSSAPSAGETKINNLIDKFMLATTSEQRAYYQHHLDAALRRDEVSRKAVAKKHSRGGLPVNMHGDAELMRLVDNYSQCDRDTMVVLNIIRLALTEHLDNDPNLNVLFGDKLRANEALSYDELLQFFSDFNNRIGPYAGIYELFTGAHAIIGPAREALLAYCASAPVYQAYVDNYYHPGNENWIAFQPTIGGTSVIDAAARMQNTQIKVWELRGDRYVAVHTTAQYGLGTTNILYNGHNHFIGLANNPAYRADPIPVDHRPLVVPSPAPARTVPTDSILSSSKGDNSNNIAPPPPAHGTPSVTVVKSANKPPIAPTVPSVPLSQPIISETSPSPVPQPPSSYGMPVTATQLSDITLLTTTPAPTRVSLSGSSAMSPLLVSGSNPRSLNEQGIPKTAPHTGSPSRILSALSSHTIEASKQSATDAKKPAITQKRRRADSDAGSSVVNSQSTASSNGASKPDATKRLFDAIMDGDYAKVQQAITEGADVMARDGKGNTPLHCAVDNWHIFQSHGIMELLIVKGADPKAVNNAKQTPDDLTDEDGNQERHNDVETAIENAKNFLEDTAKKTHVKRLKDDTNEPASAPADVPPAPSRSSSPS